MLHGYQSTTGPIRSNINFVVFFFKRERVVFVVGVERGVSYKNTFKEIVETIWTHNILLYTYDTCSYIRF